MSKKCTLREVIEANTAQSYFGTITSRFALATAFVEKAKEFISGKQKKDALIFLNLDNVYVTVEGEGGEERYIVEPFQATEEKKEVLKELPFTNFSFAPRALVQKCLEKYSENKEKLSAFAAIEWFEPGFVVKKPRIGEGCYTLATILFCILFGCHPFKDAAYYANAVEDYETELNYFSGNPNKPAFIFDVDSASEANEKPAQYMEGYHKCPTDLWKALSGIQQEFFVSNLLTSANAPEASDFFENWEAAFGYKAVTLRAPCGEAIPTMVFADEFALIATDLFVWANLARCAYCKKDLKKKCKDCPHVNTGLVEATFIDVKVTTSNGGLGKTETTQTETTLTINAGMSFKGVDLDKKNGGNEEVFSVILTKTRGVLGLEYKGKRPICVQYAGGADIVVTPNKSRFKLEPGAIIYLSDTVTLEVEKKPVKKAETPAQQPAPAPTPVVNKPAQQPAPVPAPAANKPAQPAPAPAPAANEPAQPVPAPTPAANKPAQPAPAPAPVVNKPAQPAPAPTPVVNKPAQPAPTVTQPTDEEKKYRVESERGRVYEIALKDGKPHEISSLSEAKIYMAKDLANYEWCELKVYYEKMPSLLNQNLRRLVQRGRPFEAFVWPKDILRDLPKGREGYVTSRYSRVEFNKTLGEVTSPANLSKFSRAVRVKAMIELATAFEKIHWKGYCFPVIRKDTVLFDMKKGKVCICDCEYASPIGQDSITYNKQEELFIYRAPELALDKVKASQYSDRYTLAVMLFMLLTSRHPMEGKKRFSYNANGVMSKELAEELYVANPVFIFNEKDTSNCLDQKRDAAVIELWKEVPDKIKELFQKAFTLGLPEKGQYSNAKDRECRVRPSSKTWKEELQEWLKVLEDDSND